MTNPQEWSDLEAANRTQMLLYLGTAPFVESEITRELAWVMTGIDSNDYNGVVWVRVADGKADSIIAETLEHFTLRKLPFLWHIGADSQPADLAERLEGQGCKRLDPGVCMGASLSKLNWALPKVPDLTIERVVTKADLADWMEVFDEGEGKAREQLYENLGLDGERPLRHYLARLKGRPVGVSQLFLDSQAAGLYCVAVLPEARQRGIGTAVILTALQEAKSLGYERAVLGPTYESQRLYARIGFALYPSTSIDYHRWVDWRRERPVTGDT